jgi:general secretion pathway protein G
MILQKRQRVSSRRQAFTLMEVMVVVAILVILASVSSIFVFRYLEDAKLDKARADVQTLTRACTAYKLRFQEFPASLDSLVRPPDNGQPFMQSDSDLKDPWGNMYQYNQAGPNNQGRTPDIWAVTPDQVQLGNWMK